MIPARIEEVVCTAAVECRSKEVEENVLFQSLQSAVPLVYEILYVFVLVVQHHELLQT